MRPHFLFRIFVVSVFLDVSLPASAEAQDPAAAETEKPAQQPPAEAPQEIPPQASDAAEAKEGEPRATTTGNTKIPPEHLRLFLRPLPREELEVEVLGWQQRLKEKMLEIGEHEITTQIAKESGELSVDDTAASRKMVTLQTAKADITERLRVAIDEFAEKGGDPTTYNQFLQASITYNLQSSDKGAMREIITRWLKSEDGGRLVMRRGILFFSILGIAWILSGVAAGFVSRAVEKQAAFSNLLKTFIKKMVKNTILFIGLLVAISALGVNISALFAMIGGGAFIVGFALQDTLGNLAAGVMVLIYRPFDVGDLVELSGVEGTVDSVSLVSTTLRTLDNKIVLIPNKSVWGQVITNSTGSLERRVDLVFGIGYDDDMDKAQVILEELVKRHEFVLDDPAPIIRVHELADSSVNFVCRPWTRTENYWTVYWDLTRQVKKAFDANGISIPYPQQDVHYNQG